MLVLIVLVASLGNLYSLARADDSSSTDNTASSSSADTGSSTLSINSTTTNSDTTTSTAITPSSTSDTSSSIIGASSSATSSINDPNITSSSVSSTGQLLDLGSSTPPVLSDSVSSTQPETTSTNSGASINSGDTISLANVVNVVNTNIFDSEGFLSLLNLFGPTIGSIDLQGYGFASSDCALSNCQTPLTLSNNSVGTITNNVSVMANTGSNQITNSGGNNSIVTGSSVAGANVVNVLNTNIVGSQYLLLVLNNFNSWIGDLIFPGNGFVSNTSSQGNSSNGGGDSSSTITDNNSASIANNTAATADTGNNGTSGSGSSTITTGNGVAVANNLTVANQNLVSNDQVFVVVRVFGNWTGNIWSTPPGIAWQQTPDGVVLYSSSTASLLGSLNSGCCGTQGSIQNNNSSTVRNNVSVMALTGNNQIQNSSGTSQIRTGSATAVANVMNLVNTNIIGHNILLAMINIFGNWQGDISFGKPNLWLGLRAELPVNPVQAGTETTYHLSVVNRGNANATQVNVSTEDSLANFMDVTDAGGGVIGDNGISWNIPNLAPGASTTLIFKTVLRAPVFGYERLDATVTSAEGDADATDNHDFISYAIQAPQAGGGDYDPTASLWVKETNSATSTLPPDSLVGYKILVGNDSPVPINDLYLYNILYNPFGEVVSSGTWALGSIPAGHKSMVAYNTQYLDNAITGYYISQSWLQVGKKRVNNFGTTMSSSSVYIVNPKDQKPAPVPSQHFFVTASSSTTKELIRTGISHINQVVTQITRKPSKIHLAKVGVASSTKKTQVNIAVVPPPIVQTVNTAGNDQTGKQLLAAFDFAPSLNWLYNTVLASVSSGITSTIHTITH